LQKRDFEQGKEDERPDVKKRKRNVRETAEVLWEID
jgi:hypothetical protein